MSTHTPEVIQHPPRLNYAELSPAVIQAMLGLNPPIQESGLDRRLIDLVHTRVSQINGCAFCLDMHFRDAKKTGETDDRLYFLPAWREAPVYTAQERAALRWAETLTRLADSSITDEDYAAAREEFSETELVALTMAVVAINGWNRFNVAFRTPPGSLG